LAYLSLSTDVKFVRVFGRTYENSVWQIFISFFQLIFISSPLIAYISKQVIFILAFAANKLLIQVNPNVYMLQVHEKIQKRTLSFHILNYICNGKVTLKQYKNENNNAVWENHNHKEECSVVKWIDLIEILLLFVIESEMKKRNSR
jgi:hypothetical protein